MRWLKAMQTLKNSLVIGLLVLACVLGLQLSFLLAQAGRQMNQVSEGACRTLEQTNRTLQQARPSLENLEQTTAELRAALAPRSKSLARRLLEHLF